MDDVARRLLEQRHHLAGLRLKHIALAVDTAVADVPELERLDAVEHDLLDFDLPEVLRVGREHVDQLHCLESHGDEVLQLLVHGDGEVAGHVDGIGIELVVDDDALLRRPEEGDLEGLVRRQLHGIHH